MTLPVLPADKANHWIYGSAVACVASLIAGPFVAMCAVLTVGIGKEVFDLMTERGTPDGRDAVATIAGGAVVLIPHLHSSFA